MLHLSAHCNILVIFVVTLLCMPSIKCVNFTLSCPILWRLPNFTCVGRLPETCLECWYLHARKVVPRRFSVFTCCSAKQVIAMPWLFMRTVFFFFSPVSDHSNITSNNYYNLKHFKNVKLSFIKYTCVSWLFSCKLKLFVHDNAHFSVYCFNFYNLTDNDNFFLNFISSSLLWVPEECYCMSWTFLCSSCNIHQTMGFCASCLTFPSLFCCLPISYELQIMSNKPQINIYFQG